MDDFRLSFPACIIAGKAALDAADMERLRRYAYPEGICSKRDVMTLLTINNLCPLKCPEWHDYVVESVTMYIVDRSGPQGIVDDRTAIWLARLVASDGAVHSLVELDIVLRVLETARFAPDFLVTIALDQLRLAVCEDRGAYRHRRVKPWVGVDLDDLLYIYRILRGSVARGKVILPPDQLRLLKKIDAETPAGRSHHPGWHELLEAIAPPKADTPTDPPPRWLKVADTALIDPVAAA